MTEGAARLPPTWDVDGAGELLEALFRVAGCLVVVLDTEGRVLAFNRACETLSGYSLDEVRGEPVHERLVPADLAGEYRALLGGVVDDGHCEHDCEWVTRDGSRHVIHWCMSAVRGPDGRPKYLVGTGNDVTATRRLQEELADREARMRAVLDTAVDCVVTIDERGVVQSANPAVERMFGYRPEELVGNDVRMLMPAPYADEHRGYLRRYLETGVPRIIGVGREVEGLHRDGRIFPVDIAISEVQLHDRRLFTGILRDVTERRAAEERARLRLRDLAHASRLLEIGEMSSGIAHEINQPLTAIVAYAQACVRMLRADDADLDTLRDALTQIAGQGERAGEIVRRLRRFARKGDERRDPLDLNDAVEDVIGLLGHELRLGELHLELELAAGLPRVSADRVQIEQVLVNLVRNAIDAMAASDGMRLLTVRTARAGDGARIEVADTGVGLPDEPSRVFDTFYTTKEDGMGVGLSISRTIAEAHGGRLEAAGNASGGATFTLVLPGSARPTDA